MYRFFAFSDDGSQVFIDGKPVIDNDGKHGLIKKDALLGLEKGFHELKVLYFQHTGTKKVEISYSSRIFRRPFSRILFCITRKAGNGIMLQMGGHCFK